MSSLTCLHHEFINEPTVLVDCPYVPPPLANNAQRFNNHRGRDCGRENLRPSNY